MSKYTCEHCEQPYEITPIRKCVTCGGYMADKSPAAGPWNYDMSAAPTDADFLLLTYDPMDSQRHVDIVFKDQDDGLLRYAVGLAVVDDDLCMNAWAAINLPEAE